MVSHTKCAVTIQEKGGVNVYYSNTVFALINAPTLINAPKILFLKII